jgi:hypothetical protein
MKEAALSALIRRKQQQQQQQQQEGTTDQDRDMDMDMDELGSHVRGIKDLKPVRFCLQGNKVVCPVTNKEMNGKIPAMVIVPGKGGDTNTNAPNVLSEGAFAQLSKEELEMEYGSIDYKIRLAPPLELLKDIQEQLANDPKRHHKKLKKRKRDKTTMNKEENDAKSTTHKHKLTESNGGKVAGAARTRVASAVESNKVLSSLFTTKKHISQKDHKDNLFAR